MRILVINYEFPPLGGGGGVFTRDLSLELSRHNIVDVVTTRYKGLPAVENKGNLTIYRVSVPGRTSLATASMLSMLGFVIFGAFKAVLLAVKNKYDVINTHFAVPTGPVGFITSKLSGVPNVLSLHGGDVYDPSKASSPHRHFFLRAVVRSMMNSARAVLAQSSNTKINAEKIYKPSHKVTVIPLGIPAPAAQPRKRDELGLSRDKIYLISVGRLVKRKSYDTLLTALAETRKQNEKLSLVIIGEGPERPVLAALAEDLGIKDSVMFTGLVSDEQKFKYLASSDIFVLSSMHEGFGLSILEAMASGLPVISTNEGGQLDILRAERNALFVKPCDSAALSVAILALADNSEKISAMAAANKEDFSNFSIERSAEKYIELFKVISDDTR